jgi:hypothetical protein
VQPRIAIPTITVHYDQDTITIYMAAQHRTVCCLTTLLESRVLIILITRIRVTNSGCLFLETMDPRVAPRHVVRQSIRKLAESFMFPPGITIVSENDMKTTTQITMMVHRSFINGIVLVALVALGCLSVVTAFTVPQSQIRPQSSNLLFLGAQPSRGKPLLYSAYNKSSPNDHGDGVRPIWGKFQKARKSVRHLIRSNRWMLKVRQLALTLVASAFLWFAAAGYHPLPAHASAAGIFPSSIEQLLPSASLDQMVDRYVKDHMFDDDVYDSVESAYRETYDDITTGTYPTKLKDITASVLGKSAVAVDRRQEGDNKVIAVFLQAAQLLTKFGLSEKAAQVVLAVTAFAGSFFSFVAVFGGISFVLKQNLKRELKKRYGDDYRYERVDGCSFC